PENERKGLNVDNYRDYANLMIRNVLHEVNTATNGGGTSVVFDKQDFKRLILEHQGCLVINKVETDINSVKNEHDIKDMFIKSIQGSLLHQPVELLEKQENGQLLAQKVHHVGLLAVLAPDKQISSSFMDTAKAAVINELPINGTVFNGYIVDKNNRKASVYTFFKTDALPLRLSKGLVNEYYEYIDRQRQDVYKDTSIEAIAAPNEEDEFDMYFDLADLGIYLGEETVSSEENIDDNFDVEIDALGFDYLEDYLHKKR